MVFITLFRDKKIISNNLENKFVRTKIRLKEQHRIDQRYGCMLLVADCLQVLCRCITGYSQQFPLNSRGLKIQTRDRPTTTTTTSGRTDGRIDLRMYRCVDASKNIDSWQAYITTQFSQHLLLTLMLQGLSPPGPRPFKRDKNPGGRCSIMNQNEKL